MGMLMGWEEGVDDWVEGRGKDIDTSVGSRLYVYAAGENRDVS